MIERRVRFRRGLVAARAAAVALLLIACSPTVPTAQPSAITPTTTPTSTVATDGPSTPGASAVTASCTLADLEASHGRVEGAAGSRFTTIELVASGGCSVDAYPAVGLRDANGTLLVGAAAGGPGRIDLVPEASYESDVQLGNWCADQPAFPLRLELIIGGTEVPVTGDSFADPGDLPPCNGGDGPVLAASAWAGTP